MQNRLRIRSQGGEADASMDQLHADSFQPLEGCNGDLWRQLAHVYWSERRHPGGNIEGHQDIEDVKDCEGLIGYIGNNISEILAKICARAATHPTPVAKVLSRNAAISFSMAVRIAMVETAVNKAIVNTTAWQLWTAAEPLGVQSMLIDIHQGALARKGT
eukprot:TRINITY_DN65856_c0_g1_i1.p1 TRINITY_DN65856_c0_g1~~TRINITY_DN65856_c0_g1_i1.p1  ORF type:complete len:160 (+),score=24.28 TRINITY_DN65856_c0_g1_i1:170-649(+)